ncbi:hypothetical protein Sango_0363100 [Sesamum angolense]|uniref:Uncharacterized protein n=1 Tax=Sesamum angolense TaxID=2727404 RepID=A0AAE1XA85_9LAMI|nr:hypothetical protein Sango_0363100 [Sesamum angolense]
MLEEEEGKGKGKGHHSHCKSRGRPGVIEERAKEKGWLEVLETSKKLSKDEMILRLGDGKAVAAEAMGSINLVIGDHIQIVLKDSAAKLLNMAPSKTVPQTSYKIWHGKPASYKYLGVWGSLAYIKRLVGDKLDSRSSLCRFIGYPKETARYYFYDSS